MRFGVLSRSRGTTEFYDTHLEAQQRAEEINKRLPGDAYVERIFPSPTRDPAKRKPKQEPEES
jgi:hypothetical protein